MNIIIEGEDLEYFKSVVSQGLSGSLGDIDRIQILPIGDGRIMLEANGYTSEPMGTPSQAIANAADHGLARQQTAENYRNHASESPLLAKTLEQRVADLESRLAPQ